MKKLLTMMVAAFFGCPLFATTWYVSGTSGSDGYSGKSLSQAKKTIQAAIDAASSGDTILVAAGTYAPIVTQNGKISIRSIEGASRTIIDACGLSRCVSAGFDDRVIPYTNTVVVGFTFQNGRETEPSEKFGGTGGGMEGGVARMCVFKNNSARGGGGAHKAILENCLFVNNTAAYNGGACEHSVAYNCTMINNYAEDNGGRLCIAH